MGSKRTNHKFGCFGKVCQSNSLIPSKIPFIRKCVFLNFIIILFSKSGGALAPQPLPLRRPWLSAQTKQEQRKWKALTCFRDCWSAYCLECYFFPDYVKLVLLNWHKNVNLEQQFIFRNVKCMFPLLRTPLRRY